MKNIIALLATLTCMLVSAQAQSPSLIHYQGRLVNGTNLVNGTVIMYLNLYDAPVGGTLLYSDENVAQAVNDGLYHTMLGDGTVFGTLDQALTNNQVWLEVTVNAVTLTPRERLVAVPYARAVHGLHIRPDRHGVALNPVAGTNTASGDFSVIGGGTANLVSGHYSSVGGGGRNRATLWYGTVGGGEGNSVNISYGTIGGGRTNWVSGNYGTVAGGWNNIASGDHASVGGGRTNVASGLNSTIGGGFGNRAMTTNATVGGGGLNQASGANSVIGGGLLNAAQGLYATIPGGVNNSATNYAFAAGRRAKAIHGGSLVWADSTDADFASTATNQFIVRASGGVGINTNNPQAALHVAGEAMIGSSSQPAAIGMHRVWAELPGTVFVHPATNIVMSWNAASQVLAVSNGTATAFIQVSLSFVGFSDAASVRFTRDVDAGTSASITNPGVAAGFNVVVGSDSFSAGFRFDGTSFSSSLNGLVTYWR